MTAGLEPAENRLHHLLVSQVGRANEIIEREVELTGKGAPVRCELITIILGLLSLLQRCLLHFLSVLIEPREKKDVVVQAAMPPRDHVRDDFLIRVPQVRLPVDVINRSGDVIAFTHPASVWRSQPRMATDEADPKLPRGGTRPTHCPCRPGAPTGRHACTKSEMLLGRVT